MCLCWIRVACVMGYDTIQFSFFCSYHFLMLLVRSRKKIQRRYILFPLLFGIRFGKARTLISLPRMWMQKCKYVCCLTGPASLSTCPRVYVCEGCMFRVCADIAVVCALIHDYQVEKETASITSNTVFTYPSPLLLPALDTVRNVGKKKVY